MDKLNNFIENLKQNDIRKIDLKVLFDWNYLTDMNPTKHFIYEQWIYVFVLINLVLSGLGFIFISKRFYAIRPKYRFIQKITFLWFTNTMLLLFYNLVRSEGVSFLSMRLFLIIILIAYLGILIYGVSFYILKMPKKLENFHNAKIRDRYNRNRRRDS